MVKAPEPGLNRVAEGTIPAMGKGTCRVATIRGGKRSAKRRAGRSRPVVRVGRPDASLTGLAGLVCVDELAGRLGIVTELDLAVGPVKDRDRGQTAGQLLVGMAAGLLAGQDCLTGLDRVRADVGSALLVQAPVQAPVPAATTAGGLARRFDPQAHGPHRLAGIEAGLAKVYQRWLGLVPAAVRGPLVLRNPTIDCDATDIEVYGSNKDRVGWNYAGVKCGRVHLASWAQAELPLAMDLLAGNDDVRPDAPQLLARALAVLPPQVCGRPRVRADAGEVDQSLAHAAVERGCAMLCSTTAWARCSRSTSSSGAGHGLGEATLATLQRTLLTVPARLARSARRYHLHLPVGWPWQTALTWLNPHCDLDNHERARSGARMYECHRRPATS